MAESEMKGFMFCVLYIIVFSAILSTVPAGLYGQGETAETIVPIDPSLVTGFAESQEIHRDNYTGGIFEYTMNSRQWISESTASVVALVAKKLVFGFWLGGLDICDFINPDNTNRGLTLAWTEITADAENGAVRYNLQFDNGDAAGYFVCYWNSTAYDNATQAWNNYELYFIHGIGFDTSATNNIGALLVSVLTLQVPEVPTLLGTLLAGPMWVCIIFVLWYVIKEMIPFL